MNQCPGLQPSVSITQTVISKKVLYVASHGTSFPLNYTIHTLQYTHLHHNHMPLPDQETIKDSVPSQSEYCKKLNSF